LLIYVSQYNTIHVYSHTYVPDKYLMKSPHERVGRTTYPIKNTTRSS
jgi:hypothetical protein